MAHADKLRCFGSERTLGPDEVQCFMLGSNAELILLKGNIVEWHGDAIVNAGPPSCPSSPPPDVLFPDQQTSECWEEEASMELFIELQAQDYWKRADKWRKYGQECVAQQDRHD